MGMHPPHTLLKKLFRAFDPDGSGFVDFLEFCAIAFPSVSEEQLVAARATYLAEEADAADGGDEQSSSSDAEAPAAAPAAAAAAAAVSSTATPLAAAELQLAALASSTERRRLLHHLLEIGLHVVKEVHRWRAGAHLHDDGARLDDRSRGEGEGTDGDGEHIF